MRNILLYKAFDSIFAAVGGGMEIKMQSGSAIKIVIFLILSSICLCALAYALGTFYLPQKNDFLSPTVTEPKYRTVIIDAGHGGEDGGASSVAGLVEKNVNLDISMMLSDMLTAGGVNVVMTRSDDRLLYDRNVDYKGRKKKLDHAARLAVMQNTADAIFVSIHMNSYTNPKYSGLQVWYSQNHPDSIALSDLIQNNNRIKLQPDNTRKTKGATSSIFLLDKATCPAVLVECGFLSNEAEAARFETDEYKQQVAFILFCSIMEFLNDMN